MAQFNPLVGDVKGNTQRVLALVRQARERYDAELVVFPELALLGYPPEDLLLRPALRGRIEAAVEGLLLAANDGLAILIGTPWWQGSSIYNAALWLEQGSVRASYFKHCLPNYGVFDEKRYFSPGSEACVLDYRGSKFGLTICEDIWEPHPAALSQLARADVILSLNGSPYHLDQHQERRRVLEARHLETGLPFLYVNQVGGQDELVFDGDSMVLGTSGVCLARAPLFEEFLLAVDVHAGGKLSMPLPTKNEQLQPIAEIYQALVLGVRDYVSKNGFTGAVIGLSGGIDSGLTLALAVDALGAEHVQAVMMPFRYTSEMSLRDAAEQAQCLGVEYSEIPIEKPFEAFTTCLQQEFAGLAADTTEENIQARCRGLILMAISNKKRRIVLTTGNKSEMAVGYATLYGDMAGGFAPLKDVAKTRVYELARYRNSLTPVIPENVIIRPPSAELAPDQQDTDSLPPYEVLDEILRLFVEQDFSAEDIAAQGFEADTVDRVIRMVLRNEYKRRQAPPGVKITARAFGRDRRYPITSGWARF